MSYSKQTPFNLNFLPFRKLPNYRMESVKTDSTPRAGCQTCQRDITDADADYYIFEWKGVGAGHNVALGADYVGNEPVRLHFIQHSFGG